MAQMKSRMTKTRWATGLVLLAVALVSSGCSLISRAGSGAPVAAGQAATPAPTAAPRVVSTPSVPMTGTLAGTLGLTYNGEIVPDKTVPVVAEVAGQVTSVEVEEGDGVKAGELLLSIDSTVAEAQLAQALAAVDLAQSQLDLATAKPEQTDVEAARAAVAAARATYQRALGGPTEEEKRMALAQLRQAEAAVSVYQGQYDRISGEPFAAMLPESLQLQQATLALEAAQAQHDKLMKGATADQIAGAYAQLTGAQAQLARLEQGAKPAQIKAAEAGVKQAEVGAYLAQVQLDKTTIEAPIDGFVYKLQTTAGAMTGPGNPVAVLFSHEMKILIQVAESHAQDIKPGQAATIRVDAFPDRVFDGEVSSIAPTFDAATRTVQVTVRPKGEGAGDLRSGMFATVELMEQQP